MMKSIGGGNLTRNLGELRSSNLSKNDAQLKKDTVFSSNKSVSHNGMTKPQSQNYLANSHKIPCNQPRLNHGYSDNRLNLQSNSKTQLSNSHVLSSNPEPRLHINKTQKSPKKPPTDTHSLPLPGKTPPTDTHSLPLPGKTPPTDTHSLPVPGKRPPTDTHHLPLANTSTTPASVKSNAGKPWSKMEVVNHIKNRNLSFNSLKQSTLPGQKKLKGLNKLSDALLKKLSPQFKENVKKEFKAMMDDLKSINSDKGSNKSVKGSYMTIEKQIDRELNYYRN